MGEETKDPTELARKMALAGAKMAEQAERYDEMVASMKEIIDLGLVADDLTQEERNLISVGYKNLMAHRRTSWRTVDGHMAKAQSDPKGEDKPFLDRIIEYKDTIAKEIDGVIDKVIVDVVKKYTEGPTKAQLPENLVFFHKMQGDYNRYGAEISEGAKKSEYKEKAEQAYKAATAAGQLKDPRTDECLKKTNPILLGLALNHSVFYFEICEERGMAKDLAQSAFDDALAKLDELPEEQYKDSTLIMQLLKDNLQLWSENDGPDDDESMVVTDLP
jgi:14-3-3 protein epsilon